MIKIFVFIILPMLINGYIVDPGPVVKRSHGAVWPMPFKQTIDDRFFIIRPRNFDFEIANNTCKILEDATIRYKDIIIGINYKKIKSNFIDKQMNNAHISHSNQSPEVKLVLRKRSWINDNSYNGVIDKLIIALQEECEQMPYNGMDESYNLTINEQPILRANSLWGILRGLESFSQLIYLAEDELSLKINTTEISDFPRFSHRGLLVDTSRHYIYKNVLYKILDGMSYNKLNVFHWHIVDDHSFPYESTTYPELHKMGAYTSSMVYTQQDVQNVIEYAKMLGIRVIPEFDTPGHTRSWGVSHPEILTKCFTPYAGKLGPIDPTKETTYIFINNLLDELKTVFPDQYFHIGGDEVEFECWQTNPDIVSFMNEKNITKYEVLEQMYIQRVIEKIKTINKTSIVWQEVYQNQYGVPLPLETVIQIWTGNRFILINEITGAGFPVLLSACWYLDHLATGGDWQKFYKCDPYDFISSEVQKKLILGGEACMWSESVDNTNILQRIFPRVSATAEKLWSQKDTEDIDLVKQRLEEHTCRMRARKIPAQPPNGPGFCL